MYVSIHISLSIYIYVYIYICVRLGGCESTELLLCSEFSTRWSHQNADRITSGSGYPVRRAEMDLRRCSYAYIGSSFHKESPKCKPVGVLGSMWSSPQTFCWSSNRRKFQHGHRQRPEQTIFKTSPGSRKGPQSIKTQSECPSGGMDIPQVKPLLTPKPGPLRNGSSSKRPVYVLLRSITF